MPFIYTILVKAADDNKYQIHIGTFDTLDEAILCSQEAMNLRPLISIESCNFSPSDVWYRVTIGSFKSKEDALKTVKTLNKRAIIYIPPPVLSSSHWFKEQSW